MGWRASCMPWPRTSPAPLSPPEEPGGGRPGALPADSLSRASGAPGARWGGRDAGPPAQAERAARDLLAQAPGIEDLRGELAAAISDLGGPPAPQDAAAWRDAFTRLTRLRKATDQLRGQLAAIPLFRATFLLGHTPDLTP